ncbi:MAG: YggT family protein [Chloroflexi bacterium]|nr:YggT family protein [Chloroflexota bacterium]
MIIFLVQIIQYLGRILTLIVFVDIIISYFLSPYNSFRQVLDRIVYPLLAPIRRVVPPVGMIDFSPLVLLILIQLVVYVLVQILVSI